MNTYLTNLVDRLYKQSRSLYDDVYTAWDDCKAKLTVETQLLSRTLAQHEKRVTSDLNRSSLVGKAIRARLRPDDCGPSSVEVRLRQVRQNSTISRLETTNASGEISATQDAGDMAEIARDHFASIFCDKPNDSSMHDLIDFLSDDQKLGQDVAATLEDDYTLKELTRAMRKCNKRRSPSHSGLPVEFYEATWDVTGPILLEVLNSIPDHGGVLTPSQRKRYLNLAHKKGERHKIANYRPLAAIEADARILSQAHVQRLKDHVCKMVSSEQTGFMPGRWIGTNISEMQRLIDDEDEFPGIIASVDFSNAYDRVNHMYMEELLLAYGMGPRAILWFTSTFRDVDVSVLVNGWLSAPFRQFTGVSQGCPLACMLYAIAIEPLACMIRKRVAGIQHPLAPKREHLFADDLDTALRDWNDFHAFVECLDLFEEATNAVVNVKKSFLYPLGSFRGQRGDEYDGWRIESQPFRYLGVTVGRGSRLDDIWTTATARVRQRMNAIPMYDLPIVTRCRIINVYCYSMVYYLDRFTPAPFHFIQQLEESALSAIWRGRTRTIAQARLHIPYKSGGFGLCNLYKQLAGPRALWVHRLLQQGAYKLGPYSSIIWRVNGELVRKPHIVGMTRNRNTFQLEGGSRWNWTAVFMQPGGFEAEKASDKLLKLTNLLPPRWQIYLDAWNDLVTLKSHLRNPKAWHAHFCTPAFNRLNIDIKLETMLIGPMGEGEKVPPARAMHEWTFRKAREVIDEEAYGDKPLIPIAWQKRFKLPAKRWLQSWRSLHSIRRFIPDEVDIYHRIALFNLHPASQLAGLNNDDAHFTVDRSICVLCFEVLPEDFQHLLCDCETSQTLWKLSQPPHPMPSLCDIICPPVQTPLNIRAFYAIYVFTVWKWARSRRYNNYGVQPRVVSDLELTTKATRLHTAWNRHSFFSAAQRQEAKAVARRFGLEPERRQQLLELLPYAE